MLNGWEIVLIFMLALILFGAKKLPELARGLGQGIREFKRATQGISDEVQQSLSDAGGTKQAPPPKQNNTPPSKENPSSLANLQHADADSSSTE